MSEAWHGELAKNGIKVSVLCLAFVKTRIHLSGRNRQDHYKNAAGQPVSVTSTAGENPAKRLVENGIPAKLVGSRVVEALESKELYIFTHPSHRAGMQKRFEAIDQAFASAAASPLLADIVEEEIVLFEKWMLCNG